MIYMKTSTDINGVRDSILLSSDDRFKKILENISKNENDKK